ncbi:hypothetical protein DMUE_2796 [Dictyocoela muelleri]|nr:hypothetical protein DMUE_2796 [Dictyocoela muelleri]
MTFLKLPLKNELFSKIKSNLCNKSLEHLEECLETCSFEELKIESEMFKRFAQVCFISTNLPVFNSFDLESAIIAIYNLYFSMKSLFIASPDVRKSLKANYKRSLLLPKVIYSELYKKNYEYPLEIIHADESCINSYKVDNLIFVCSGDSINHKNPELCINNQKVDNLISDNSETSINVKKYNSKKNKYEKDCQIQKYFMRQSGNDKYFNRCINKKMKIDQNQNNRFSNSKEKNTDFFDKSKSENDIQSNENIAFENNVNKISEHGIISMNRLIKIHLLKEKVKLKKTIKNGKLIIYGKYFSYKIILCGEISNPIWKIIDINLNLQNDCILNKDIKSINNSVKNSKSLLKYFPDYQKETLTPLINLDKILSIHIDLKKISPPDQNYTDQKILFMEDAFLKICLDKNLSLEISINEFSEKIIISPDKYEIDILEKSLKSLADRTIEIIFNNYLAQIFNDNDHVNDKLLPNIYRNIEKINTNLFNMTDVSLDFFKGLFIKKTKIKNLNDILKLKNLIFLDLFNFKDAIFEDGNFIFKRTNTQICLFLKNFKNDQINLKIEMKYKNICIPLFLSEKENIILRVNNKNNNNFENINMIMNCLNNNEIEGNNYFKFENIKKFIESKIDLIFMIPELLNTEENLEIQIDDDAKLIYENHEKIIFLEIKNINKKPTFDLNKNNSSNLCDINVQILNKHDIITRTYFYNNLKSNYSIDINDLSDILFIKDFIILLEYHKFYKLGVFYKLKRVNQIIYGKFDKKKIINDEETINNSNNKINDKYDFKIFLKNLTLQIFKNDKTIKTMNLNNPISILKFLYLLSLGIYPRLFKNYFLIGNLKIHLNDFNNLTGIIVNENIINNQKDEQKNITNDNNVKINDININKANNTKIINKRKLFNISIDDTLLEIKAIEKCNFPCPKEFCFHKCRYFKNVNKNKEYDGYTGYNSSQYFNNLKDKLLKLNKLKPIKISLDELNLYYLLFRKTKIENELKRHFKLENGFFCGKKKFMIFVDNGMIRFFVLSLSRSIERELNYIANEMFFIEEIRKKIIFL